MTTLEAAKRIRKLFDAAHGRGNWTTPERTEYVDLCTRYGAEMAGFVIEHLEELLREVKDD